MGAVTIQETLVGEAAALAKGWSEEQLLDLAGNRLGRAIARFFPTSRTAVGYLGKGHNAGDTIVALTVLRDCFGWDVHTRHGYPVNEWSPLTRRKWEAAGLPPPLDHAPAWREMEGAPVLLDGLLGIGASGDLRAALQPFAMEMDCLRQEAGARVAAVDLPSGVDPDTGEIHSHAVTADVTFMIGNAKVGLLLGRAAAACGALALVPVEPLVTQGASDLQLISPQTVGCGKSPRPFDFHKGLAGRVALVVGSEDYTGAAILSATGALRGGAGLITLFVPRAAWSIVAAKCPAEIIVRPFDNPSEVLATRFDALVTGCGLGELNEDVANGLLELISQSPAPVVIDADALNLISRRQAVHLLQANHVVTPHPGEFARLAPDAHDLDREEQARKWVMQTTATLLLKGSRTIVARRGHPLRCNATGTPAMASGGQGDLLAGVIGARLAAGDPPEEAASLGAWICGRAAELAMLQPNFSEDSLVAGDVANYLGGAFRDWRSSRR